MGDDGATVRIPFDLATSEQMTSNVRGILIWFAVAGQELGAPYEQHLREEMAQIMLTARVDAPDRAVWPGLRVGADETRRALRQPTTAAPPIWQPEPPNPPSAV